MTAPAMTGSAVVRGVCPHDCPDTYAMLVTVSDGRAINWGSAIAATGLRIVEGRVRSRCALGTLPA